MREQYYGDSFQVVGEPKKRLQLFLIGLATVIMCVGLGLGIAICFFAPVQKPCKYVMVPKKINGKVQVVDFKIIKRY